MFVIELRCDSYWASSEFDGSDIGESMDNGVGSDPYSSSLVPLPFSMICGSPPVVILDEKGIEGMANCDSELVAPAVGPEVANVKLVGGADCGAVELLYSAYKSCHLSLCNREGNIIVMLYNMIRLHKTNTHCNIFAHVKQNMQMKIANRLFLSCFS